MRSSNRQGLIECGGSQAKVASRVMRTVIATLMLCWTLVVMLSAAPAASPSLANAQNAQQGSAAPPAAPAPHDPANPRPTAAFLGADTCVACHDGLDKSYLNSPHGK